jgi:5-methylcytosine-specific restriction endonuclease McrA
MNQRIICLLKLLGKTQIELEFTLEQYILELIFDDLVAEYKKNPPESASSYNKRLKVYLEKNTQIEWTVKDVLCIANEVRSVVAETVREPISASDKFRLSIIMPMECSECKKKPPEVELHIDHIRPVKRGGTNNLDNLQFLCQRCNLKKGARFKPIFRLELGKLAQE